VIFQFKNKKKQQKEWKLKTIEYARQLNEFIKKGILSNWEDVGDEPSDNGREKYVDSLLKEIRKANESGTYDELRENWPLAHSPLIKILGENGQSIPTIKILDDSRIVARIGTHYQEGYVIEIQDEKVTVLTDVEHFGATPNNDFFAYTQENGVIVTKGWLGETVSVLPYPQGTENVPEGFDVEPFDVRIIPSRLIPFPDGKRVLFVAPEGIFVLEEENAVRLLPTDEDMREHFKWLQDEYPDDALEMSLDMEHGAVSPDGKYIVVGSQDSSHLIFNDNYELVGDIGNMSEYPHYAIFNNASDYVALNSCHFYNGITIGVELGDLPLETEAYEENEKVIVLEELSRVYAGVCRNDEFIIGDASGYIRAFDKAGKQLWFHFIGSSVGDIDISKDGQTLVCSTYAGFISIISLDGKDQKDYEIGSGQHTESRRWILWKNEPKPLIW